MRGGMDLSVLPNNNHPDKFLQLDVKSLMRNSALLQASLVRFPGGNYPAAQHWQNLVYSQVRSGSTRICGWGLAVFSASATSSSVRKGYRQQYGVAAHSCHRKGLSLFVKGRRLSLVTWLTPWTISTIRFPSCPSFSYCLLFRFLPSPPFRCFQINYCICR